MVQKINVTEPDFAEIKRVLKDFLKAQTELLDYNFEGSGMAVLLDILAYNTAYLAFYANKVGNEMFLDSAVLRESLASRAKMLGYRPRSRRGAKAVVNLEIMPDDSPATVTIARGTKFSTVLDGKTYTFSNLESQTIEPDENDDFLTTLDIYEGEVLSYKFTVDSGDPDQRFVIPNEHVDTSTLRVRVQESESNSTTYVYALSSDLTVVDRDSKVYFLQEVEGGATEIYFGDGVVGVKPENGNLILVDYLAPSGEIANGLSDFQPQLGIGGYNSYTVETEEVSSGGSEREDEESIRFLAPLAFQAQGRAVTKGDYETLLVADYPNIDSIRVWGGEDNVPPYYGKVFVAIKPIEGLTLSAQTKESLVKNVIRKRNMVSVEVEILDPEYIFLKITTLIKWKSSLTDDSQAEVQAAIREAMVTFGEDELDKFDTYFRYSKFIQVVDASHEAVLNNLTSIKLSSRMEPSLTLATNYVISFSNALDPVALVNGEPTLSSTSFVLDGYTCYFDDDGEGVVRAYRILEGEKVFVRSSIGTLDYATGRLQINQFLPTSFSGDFIILSVRPKDLDIKTERSQLLLIDEDSIFIDMEDEALLS